MGRAVCKVKHGVSVQKRGKSPISAICAPVEYSTQEHRLDTHKEADIMFTQRPPSAPQTV